MQRFSEQTVPNTSSIVIGPASDWQEILIWSSDWLLAPDLPELTGGADKRKVGHICQVIMYGGRWGHIGAISLIVASIPDSNLMSEVSNAEASFSFKYQKWRII